MSEVIVGDYVVASNSKAGNPAERWTCGIVLPVTYIGRRVYTTLNQFL